MRSLRPSGAGYGPPSGRTPTAIARDLAEGVIDAGTASTTYGFKA